MNVKIMINPLFTTEILDAGYLISKDGVFDADYFWHLCNWHHWSDTKPNNLFSEIGNCSHGIIFVNPETNEHHLALSVGWKVGNKDEIYKYILENYNEPIWGDIYGFLDSAVEIDF